MDRCASLSLQVLSAGMADGPRGVTISLHVPGREGEGGKEGGREGGREERGRSEGGREGGTEGEREGEREGKREGGREGIKRCP